MENVLIEYLVWTGPGSVLWGGQSGRTCSWGAQAEKQKVGRACQAGPPLHGEGSLQRQT